MREANGNHFNQLIGVLGKVALVLSVALTGIGVTHTYSQHKAQQENILTAHSVEIGISENPSSGFQISPGENVSKNVKFINEGSAPVFLRVTYAETWKDKNGNWLENRKGFASPHWTDTGAPDMHIDSDLWFSGGDGWYYYKKILVPNGETEPIMDHVTFAAGLPDEYRNGSYDLLWSVEAVQFSTDETLTSGKTVNERVLLATFGRTATISNLQDANGMVITATVHWQ